MEKLFFSSRATSILIDICRLAARPEVLLPSLYCAEVSAALEEAGLKYRCYDVPADLSDVSAAVNSAYDSNIGAIIVMHPFGLSRPPKSLGKFENTFVIEDACHALRTSYENTAIGGGGNLTVFSPRKELGWLEGGIASGPLASKLSEISASSSAISLDWRSLNLKSIALEGRKATKLAVEALTNFLPAVNEKDVLTALPLKSAKRDDVISKLRSDNIAAWRWIKPLKNTGKRLTPQSFELRKQLFLVPLPVENPNLKNVLEKLKNLPLEPWR